MAHGKPDVGHPDLQVAPAGLVFGPERRATPRRLRGNRIAGPGPHRRVTRRLAPFMGETRFEMLTVAGERLPLGWPEIQQQILGGSPRR